MTVIAVLGTGHMGTPITRRLLAAGHEVTVWNRHAERAAPLVRAGARLAATPAAAVADAEVVIVMVRDAAAVEAVLFDAPPGGTSAAAAVRAGGCVVQMSTIAPAEVRRLARRMPSGVDLVDAPVAGGVAAAEAGRLTVLAAGDDTVVERVRPVLETLGGLHRCGPLGAGAALKLVLNTALATGVAALGETLAVADALGVDRAGALAALASGPLGGAVARVTGEGNAFAVDLAAKDLALVLAETGGAPAGAGRAVVGSGPGQGGAEGTELPMVRAALRALHAAPDPRADLAALAVAAPAATTVEGAVATRAGRPDASAGGDRRDGPGRSSDTSGGHMRVSLDNPSTVPPPVGPYAHVARVDVGGGTLLMTAGQIAVDDDGAVVAPGDVVAQAERIFELIGGILAAHGAGLADVLHIRTFMTNLDDLPAYGQVRRRLFPNTPPPASTTVEVSRLFRPGAVLEVEVTAAVPAAR